MGFSKLDLEDSALLVIDVQNDFLPGGSLAVPNGDEVIEPINRLTTQRTFRGGIYFSKDWHPKNHVSFASNHNDQKPFTSVILDDGVEQMLWPDHCIQGTTGAKLSSNLVIPDGAVTIHKGLNGNCETYSAFGDDKCVSHSTCLTSDLRSKNISTIIMCGLAFDVCVMHSAIDAAKQGFNVFVLKDVCVRDCTNFFCFVQRPRF